MSALFDDAAIFPPGNAPLPQAVPAHREHVQAWYADLVGPFLCATSRVPQLQEALVAADALAPLPVTLIADSGVLGVEQARNLLLDDDRVELVGLEVALPRDGDPHVFAQHTLEALSFAVPTAIEVPVVPGWEKALDVLAADGAERAKFRTGGPTGAAVPAPDVLADLIHATVTRALPYKLTAGLHHALHGMEETEGVPHHGFLNVLAATAAAADGADRGALADLLVLREAEALLRVLRAVPPSLVRARLTSIGTCSIADPVADLVALGLLEKETE